MIKKFRKFLDILKAEHVYLSWKKKSDKRCYEHQSLKTKVNLILWLFISTQFGRLLFPSHKFPAYPSVF